MKFKLNFVLIVSLGCLIGCEDEATRQSRKNRGAGQTAAESSASSSGASGFSASVEQNRAQHLQATQDLQVLFTEFTEAMESIKDIPSANQNLRKCDPLMDKMDALLKKVAGFPKLSAAEKEGLETQDRKDEALALGARLKRAIGSARGHLVLSDKEETFNEILSRFEGIVKKGMEIDAQGH